MTSQAHYWFSEAGLHLAQPIESERNKAVGFNECVHGVRQGLLLTIIIVSFLYPTAMKSLNKLENI